MNVSGVQTSGGSLASDRSETWDLIGASDDQGFLMWRSCRPESVSACPDFRCYLDGRIRPTAAFEFGLNEKYGHLRADVAKLINNRLRYGCVIHFVRPGETDNFDRIEELVAQAARNGFLQRPMRESKGKRQVCTPITN